MMSPPPAKSALTAGFTLIELSIVLVIIGLIVGSVMAGRHLIHAATLQAAITQIKQFNTAATTFQAKYNALPGDIPNAGSFGFTARSGIQGLGDGNGVIEGYDFAYNRYIGWNPGSGEAALFWSDLSQAGLIEGSFTFATGTGACWKTQLCIPQSKIGSAYVYVYSACYAGGCALQPQLSVGVNYFGLSAVSQGINAPSGYIAGSDNGISVQDASAIDRKIDDGLPTTGRVIAAYPNGGGCCSVEWAPSAVSPSSTTCFDTTSNQYSMTQNDGTNVTCGLSVQFQ